MNRTSKSRTFTAVCNHRLEGILMDKATHTVTMSRSAGQYSATVDGQSVDVHTAARLLTWAKEDSVLTEVETVESISMGEACNLHRVMGGFGFRGHYALASELVGRDLSSLTQLSSDGSEPGARAARDGGLVSFYPAYLTPNALRTLAGLHSPALPARGQSLTVTRHVFHPDQSYTVAVNAFGDVEITVRTQGKFGYSYGIGHCVCRNSEAL